MKRKRRPRIVGGTLTVRPYPVLSTAVESGVRCGIRRAYKHESRGLPDADVERIADHVCREVLNDVCEAFAIADPEAPE